MTNKTGVPIREFIKTYDHINYTECILYPDGSIDEAIPSHTMKLCEIYNDSLSIQEISEHISPEVSPLEWLTHHTGCIAVWYESIDYSYRSQEITEKQYESLNLLYEAGLLSDNCMVLVDYYIKENIQLRHDMKKCKFISDMIQRQLRYI